MSDSEENPFTETFLAIARKQTSDSMLNLQLILLLAAEVGVSRERITAMMREVLEKPRMVEDSVMGMVADALDAPDGLRVVGGTEA